MAVLSQTRGGVGGRPPGVPGSAGAAPAAGQPVRRGAGYTAMLLTLVVVTSCATTTPPSRPTVLATATALPAADPSVDYRDPDAVCTAFITAVHTRDPATDAGPLDSWRRAAPYMTGELHAAAIGHSGPDGRWPLLVEHGARTRVELAPYAGDAHADDATQPRRVRVVTVTPVGANGWRGPADRFVLACRLAPDAAGWRVAGYDIEPLGGGS